MNYRPLGASGLQVSEIGFGAWGIGGVVKDASAYGQTDDRVSRRALEAAFEAGVTFYDTAALYGYGHSEELIGETLKSVRDRIIISTKAGFVDFSGKQDFSPAYLRSSLEASLKRLQTDYVDVFQLHDPPIELLEDDDTIMSTLKSMRSAGTIRVIGVSTRTPADSLIAVERLGFKAVQINFNLVDQRALEIGLLPACRKHGAGIIVRTPLCFGFLTGKYVVGEDYAVGDHRRRWRSEQIELWARACNLFTAETAHKDKQTNAQVALRYILSFGEVSTTIPGMLTDEQVAENVVSSEMGPLSAPVLDVIAETYRRHNFFCKGDNP